MNARLIISVLSICTLLVQPASAEDAPDAKGKAYYQEQLKQELTKVAFQNVSAKEAFAIITKKSGVPIDASKVTSKIKVTLMFDKIPANEAMLFVCAITGTSPDVTDKGVVILNEPLKKDAKKKVPSNP